LLTPLGFVGLGVGFLGLIGGAAIALGIMGVSVGKMPAPI
jgi:hypothetical protein